MTRACPSIRGRTAVVLDQDPGTRERLARAMNKAGLLVLEAASEDEAALYGRMCLELQCLVVDVGVTSFQSALLLDFLRALHPELRFLIMSANDCEQMVQTRLGTSHVVWLSSTASDAELSAAVVRMTA